MMDERTMGKLAEVNICFDTKSGGRYENGRADRWVCLGKIPKQPVSHRMEGSISAVAHRSRDLHSLYLLSLEMASVAGRSPRQLELECP